MAALIIKEHMRLQDGQYSGLLHATQEERLIGRNAPTLQRGDNPLMSGGISCSDDRNPNYFFVFRIFLALFLLQLLHEGKLFEQIRKGPRSMRNGLPLGFVRLKCHQIMVFLIHGLRFIVGNDAVKVEGHAQFIIQLVVVNFGREHHTGGVVCIDGFLNIVFVSAQEIAMR